jgi:hypothetical protein
VRRRGGLMLAGAGRLRTDLTLAGVLLVAAGTQVVPDLPAAAPTPEMSVVAALPGVPFEARIEANLDRVHISLSSAGEQRWALSAALAAGRQWLHFDPEGNGGRGSWAELVGSIDERTEAVGILVPGSAAFIDSDNFFRYHQRATDLVEVSEGRLAVVIWAAGDFPQGWLQGAITRYQRALGQALALFSQELRAELARELGPGNQVRLVVAGHSFGGAVVGAAERHGLDADAVLHVASAGVGEVSDPHDYPEPERPRYSITAPGDLIGWVQGLPLPPGLGHGPDPDTFRCVIRLPAGHLPDDPAALGELGEPLRARAGSPIRGWSAHSDVFIRYSDAWWQIYRVFLGRAPVLPDCPPPAESRPLHARVLPLAVPRVVTDSQCRAGSGLRPGDRHRLLSRLR